MTLVRAQLDDGTVVTVGDSFAKSKGLTIVDEPAVEHGRTVPAFIPVTIKGAALNEALTAAGLPLDGLLAEKQQRLAEFNAAASSHQTSDADPGAGGTPDTE